MVLRNFFLSTCLSLCSFHLFSQALTPNQNKHLRDTVIKFDAQPELGFNYPYFIRLPKGMDLSQKKFLLVETNNTGVNDTLAYHERGAYLEAIKNSLGSSLCTNLKIPFLVPVFPRPQKNENLYTHAFDRDAALLNSGEMKRLDLQLIAMIKNAAIQLDKMKITVHDKILMNGFSASGTFANRFTLIHPELIAGVASGGINAMPILPVRKIGTEKLIYPLGIYDHKIIFKDTVHFTAYKKLPQYIYMGAKDTNDAVLFDDAYGDKERKIIHQSIGKVMQPDRWVKCQEIYKREMPNVSFKTYPNIGHETDQEVFMDVYTFFKKIIQSANQ
jgi:hypothetical protein